MTPKPTVLGVVTARAGSKGIPGKNTRRLAGKPLIAYTIESALASGAFDRLMLSTDDEEAARIALRGLGCEVPFVRPASLSADDTPHLPVMQHAVAWMRDHQHYEPDWVMILMPTSPLRQPFHIVESIALALESGADSVVSVDEMPAHFNPMRALTIDADGWAWPLVGDQPNVKRRLVRPAGRAEGVGPQRCDLPVPCLVVVRSGRPEPVRRSGRGVRDGGAVREQHRRSRRLGECRAFAGPIALTQI